MRSTWKQRAKRTYVVFSQIALRYPRELPASYANSKPDVLSTTVLIERKSFLCRLVKRDDFSFRKFVVSRAEAVEENPDVVTRVLRENVAT